MYHYFTAFRRFTLTSSSSIDSYSVIIEATSMIIDNHVCTYILLFIKLP